MSWQCPAGLPAVVGGSCLPHGSVGPGGSPGEGGPLRAPSVLPSAWCRRAGRGVMLLLAWSHSQCGSLQSWEGVLGGGDPPHSLWAGHRVLPVSAALATRKGGGSGGVAVPVVQRCPAHGSSSRAESRRPRPKGRGVDERGSPSLDAEHPGQNGTQLRWVLCLSPAAPRPSLRPSWGGLYPRATRGAPPNGPCPSHPGVWGGSCVSRTPSAPLSLARGCYWVPLPAPPRGDTPAPHPGGLGAPLKGNTCSPTSCRPCPSSRGLSPTTSSPFPRPPQGDIRNP